MGYGEMKLPNHPVYALLQRMYKIEALQPLAQETLLGKIKNALDSAKMGLEALALEKDRVYAENAKKMYLHSLAKFLDDTQDELQNRLDIYELTGA